MITSFKRWFVRRQNDIIFCFLTYQFSNSFAFCTQIICSSIFFSLSLSKILLFVRFDVSIEINHQQQIFNWKWEFQSNFSFSLQFSAETTDLSFKYSKHFELSLKFALSSLNDDALECQFTFEFLFDSNNFNSTISFVFSSTNNLFNKFWKLQLAFLFLFCLSSFYFKSQYDTSFSSKSFWLFSHHKSFALRLSYSITSIQLTQFILSIHLQKLLWTIS